MSEVERVEGAGARLSVWRDGPDWQGPTATIGALRCDSAETGARLIGDTCDRLAAEGIAAVLGPMEGDTWHAYRLVEESDGSPPFLMEPASAAHDRAAFEGAGFSVVSRYFSARVALGDHPPAPAPEDGATVVPWDGTDAEAALADIHALSTRAFAGNPFYKPIALEPFLAMYRPFLPLLVPDLVLFARDADGALAGFLFAIPNYAEGPKPSQVILKTYASARRGAGSLLARTFHARAQEMGYEAAIHALIHDDNTSADRSRRHGGEIFRRYALLGRRL